MSEKQKNSRETRGDEKKNLYEIFRAQDSEKPRITYRLVSKKMVENVKFYELYLDGKPMKFFKCNDESCEKAGFLAQHFFMPTLKIII